MPIFLTAVSFTLSAKPEKSVHMLLFFVVVLFLFFKFMIPKFSSKNIEILDLITKCYSNVNSGKKSISYQ